LHVLTVPLVWPNLNLKRKEHFRI